MIDITAVIITLNEEKNIGRCIDSLLGVVKEIIVVDSFSTDKTKEICEEKGVTFIQRHWEGYTKTKNWANEQATSEYILSLDADEALSPELKNSIQSITLNQEDVAYSFNRKTNYCGKWIKHSGWYPDVKTRLFKKGQAIWEGAFVHEVLRLSPGIKIIHLKGDLLHYSFYTTEDHYKTVEKYATLKSEKLLTKGVKPTWIRMNVNPLIKFLKSYIFQLGFLDGLAGFQIARISAKGVRLKYKKLKRIM